MFCITIIGHWQTSRPKLLQSSKGVQKIGKPLHLLRSSFRRLIKNVNDVKWPLYGLSVPLGLDGKGSVLCPAESDKKQQVQKMSQGNVLSHSSAKRYGSEVWPLSDRAVGSG